VTSLDQGFSFSEARSGKSLGTRLLKDLEGKIDPRQYACKGHSTTDALLYMMQTIHEAFDRIEAGARNFFADFSKGFDLIDHYLLSVRHRGHKFGSYFFFHFVSSHARSRRACGGDDNFR
jgi:hypothetical protein